MGHELRLAGAVRLRKVVVVIKFADCRWRLDAAQRSITVIRLPHRREAKQSTWNFHKERLRQQSAFGTALK
jgi:hypothetical protein